MLFGKNVNKYYLKYFSYFLLGLLALIVVNWFQLEIPRICGQILDGLSEEAKNKADSLFNNPERIKILMLELFGIAAIMFIGRFSWRYCIFGVACRIESDMRQEMFSHSLMLSNSYYKQHKTGALMALFTNDLQVIKQAFGNGTIMFIDAIFLGGFALYKMFKTNWMLAALSILPLILTALITLFVGKVLKEKFRLRQEAYENLSDFTQENFSGMAVIKAFVKEVHEIRHFKKINEDNRVKNIDYARYSTLLNVLLTATISTIIGLLFGGGSYFVINGFMGNTFSVGQMFEFIGYFDSVVWPFMAVASLINMKAQAKASLIRIDEFLDSKIEIVDKDVENVNEILGKIEFRHLNFTYPDGSNQVLSDISLVIPAGTMVGIIGKTGCGKTTIVDLLLRTYNIAENELFIDDRDIMHIPFRQVRESIGYVPQDNFLFSDTIVNNISFAFSDTLDQETIENAAKLSLLHDNIMEFGDRYETILGERGVTLSGGQKQRLSIARALIKDPPILIFDDSVSAVDTKTEKEILANLKTVRQNKTTIIIAHRLSTVEDLDMIVVMDEGKVLATGKHQDLLSCCKLYQEMVHLQSLEKKVVGGDH